jgi:AcrR family transcriptional regulator
VDAATGSWVQGRQVAPAGDPGMSAGGGAFLRVVPAVESFGPDGEQLVREVRAVPSPLGDVLVGGSAAELLDTKSALLDRLPLAVGLVLGLTVVLLFLFTGSVLIPVKALVLNVLSLCATFGAMVWIFQEGILTGLIGDPVVTGTLNISMPILMFCVLFGLSMDYEVFLISRIKEVWDETGDNARAVAVGLQRTGGIITAAAGLLSIVFLGFVSSDISFIKLLGLGTALAIVVDADAHPRAPRPGLHAPGRPRQLVGAGAAAPPARALRPERDRGRWARMCRCPPSASPPVSEATAVRRRAPAGAAPSCGRDPGRAMQLLTETGDESAVSVRAVAQRVGVSVPSIYLHFADKRALIDAVCGEVFEALHQRLRAAAEGAEHPFAALRAQGNAYVHFALENPEHYRVVMMQAHEPRRSRSTASSRAGPSATSWSRCRPASTSACSRASRRAGARGCGRRRTGVAALLVVKPYFPWPDLDAFVDRTICMAGWARRRRTGGHVRRHARPSGPDGAPGPPALGVQALLGALGRLGRLLLRPLRHAHRRVRDRLAATGVGRREQQTAQHAEVLEEQRLLLGLARVVALGPERVPHVGARHHRGREGQRRQAGQPAGRQREPAEQLRGRADLHELLRLGEPGGARRPRRAPRAT